jgi:hypothetical protein
LGSKITLKEQKMSETKIVGTFGAKVFIVYDERGVEVPDLLIRSVCHNHAEKTAQAMFGKKASVAYTEV